MELLKEIGAFYQDPKRLELKARLEKEKMKREKLLLNHKLGLQELAKKSFFLAGKLYEAFEDFNSLEFNHSEKMVLVFPSPERSYRLLKLKDASSILAVEASQDSSCNLYVSKDEDIVCIPVGLTMSKTMLQFRQIFQKFNLVKINRYWAINWEEFTLLKNYKGGVHPIKDKDSDSFLGKYHECVVTNPIFQKYIDAPLVVTKKCYQTILSSAESW